MDRRGLLTWICRVAATACAAVVAIPGVAYLVAPLARQGKSAALVQRLCPLDDLVPDKPSEHVLTGNRRDAWTLYPQQVLGRVWLVRRTGPDVPPGDAKVDAFSAICPHLECLIGMNSAGDGYFCACHKADFALSGDVVQNSDAQEKNPAPRAMDSLTCRVVQDEATEAWWVEVEYLRFRPGVSAKTPLA